MKNDESKKDSKSKLGRLNKLKRSNRLKKLNYIMPKKIFKSNNNNNKNNKNKSNKNNKNNNFKCVKSVISNISDKIDDLIVVKNDKVSIVDNIDKNSINNENINGNINNTNTNISESIQDKNSNDFPNDFLDKIEEDFDDDYYRRIEPTKEEIKHENYLKSFDRNHLKSNKRNNFNNSNNSNDFDGFSKENGNFDKYFPKGITKSDVLANEPMNFRQENPKSISSGPLSDKFGSVNKVEKEKNEKLDFKNVIKLDKNPIKKFKKSITKDDDSKTVFGAAIFGLVLIVLLFSAYYFLFYQPYQDDLSATKINKLNELNSLFKGPLALDPNVLIINSEIELAKSPQEVNAIDIIRPATASWRVYQSKQINKTKDDFNRVMITYETSSENKESSTIGGNGGNNQISKAEFVYAESTNGLNNKNVIMDANDAQSFVNENDGMVLANIVFKKPDTVAVPILVTRLQAGAGLISIGSIIDIYSLSDSNYQHQSSDSSSSSVSDEPNSANSDSNNGSNGGSDSTNGNNGNSNSSSGFDGSINSQSLGKTFSNSPDISGSTVLAIMRSKDSGVISADYIKSQTKINGNNTNQVQDSRSFSTDVEEMIKGSISGGYDEKRISSLLDSYGLKLSDYERQSNLAELDVQYLLLIEVPREDVPYVINNMENIILTIPTNNAPNWMVNELKATYSKT